MLIILSPSKTMKQDAGYDGNTIPEFFEEAGKINAKLRMMSAKQLSDLMKMNLKLGTENAERNKQWNAPESRESATPALLSYDGEQYRNIKADNFTNEELNFAQRHLRILSGLYGVLRPKDAILPYRLEMLAPLPVGSAHSLYEFWSDRITDSLAESLKQMEIDSPILINLASGEYSKCVKKKELGFPMITINFKEKKGDRFKSVSVYAKQARGMMAGYIIRNRITDYNKIQSFNEAGYSFNPDLSNDTQWIFSRK